MSGFSAFDWLTFLTILFLTFSLFLVITGAFTAYFGSGKSRKIGVGLLVGGLIVGVMWAWYAGPLRWRVRLVNVIVESIGAILAAVIGAAAAIGLFLLAIMKSCAGLRAPPRTWKAFNPRTHLVPAMPLDVLLVLGSMTLA